MVKEKYMVSNLIEGISHQSATSTLLVWIFLWFYCSLTVVKAGWGYDGMINE